MVQWWRAAAGCLRTAVLNPSLSPSLSSSSTSATASYHTIQAIMREFTGSRVSARDRAQGRIPAVVFSEKFGKSEEGVVRTVARKRLLTTEKKQIQAILKSGEPDLFCSTTFQLQIRAGSGSSVLIESGTVLPIKIHRDKETGKIMNLVFVWAEDGTELKVDVPIILKGEEACPGLAKGGNLNRIRTSLKYLCPAEHIPPKIEVDISNLDIGEGIFLRDIMVHPSLKLLSKNETRPICKIHATQKYQKTAEEV